MKKKVLITVTEPYKSSFNSTLVAEGWEYDFNYGGYIKKCDADVPLTTLRANIRAKLYGCDYFEDMREVR